MEKIPKWLLTVLAAALIFSFGVAAGGRYESSTALSGATIRLDRLTGEIVACDAEVCWNVLQSSQPVTASSIDEAYQMVTPAEQAGPAMTADEAAKAAVQAAILADAQ